MITKATYSKELLTYPSKLAFLGVLDLIFDYLPFEDLERVAGVWKFFWYTAFLDKLFEKYETQNQTFIHDEKIESKQVLILDIINLKPFLLKSLSKNRYYKRILFKLSFQKE